MVGGFAFDMQSAPKCLCVWSVVDECTDVDVGVNAVDACKLTYVVSFRKWLVELCVVVERFVEAAGDCCMQCGVKP